MGLWILLVLASLAGVSVMILLPLRCLRNAPPWIRRSVAGAAGGLGVLLGVWIPGEILMRRAGMQPYGRTFPGQFENAPKPAPWARVDPALGWTAAPGYRGTNPQGFRDRRDFDALAREPSKTRVMILGDSFVWGSMVGTDETIPALLERALGDGFECFGVGAPGWGIDQMVLAHRRFEEALAPDVVILVFIDDDVPRVLEAYRRAERMNKPCFEVRDDVLVPQDSPTALEGLLNRVGLESVFFGRLLQGAYVLSEARPVVRRMLADLAQATTRTGGKLVLVRIPDRDDHTLGASIGRRLVSCAEAAEAAGARYLEPEFMRVPGWETDFYLWDGHLSARGNQFMAEYLKSHVFQEENSH